MFVVSAPRQEYWFFWAFLKTQGKIVQHLVPRSETIDEDGDDFIPYTSEFAKQGVNDDKEDAPYLFYPVSQHGLHYVDKGHKINSVLMSDWARKMFNNWC